MPEVNVVGANPISYPQMASWEWQVPVYLFLGGLVAGLMIFAGVLGLRSRVEYRRAVLAADVAGLPLLAVGLLMLWLDLANRWNVWRFFVTFQVRSAMSWGSWILLVTMALLAIRLIGHLRPWHPPATRAGRWLRPLAWLWNLAGRVGGWFARRQRGLDVLTVVLGVGLGYYTGLLLSTIPARPLWNSSVLAPLFLASGLAGGGAFLFLFSGQREQSRLLPSLLLIGGVELLLLLAYVLNFVFGNGAVQAAGDLLYTGNYAIGFWGVFVGAGLLLPLLIEGWELSRRHFSPVTARLTPLLVLVGGLVMRFVIVFAGLESRI